MINRHFFKFTTNFKIFILFLIFLLLEGIFHFYYHLISQKIDYLEYKDQTGYNTIIWSENGLVELLQIIFLIISIIFVIKFLKNRFKTINIYLKIFMIFYCVGIIYYFFEEISWGQHFFGWYTPDVFSKFNKQNETNIHNISSIFNELPRNMLLIWCSLSFFFYKFFKLKFPNFSQIIYPSTNLKFISILILFFFIPDLIIDKLNLAPGHPAKDNTEILLNNLFEIISFNFVRLSELQELFFNFYIVCHAYYLSIIDSK